MRQSCTHTHIYTCFSSFPPCWLFYMHVSGEGGDERRGREEAQAPIIASRRRESSAVESALKLLLLFISKVNFVLYHSNSSSMRGEKGRSRGGVLQGATVKSARHRMGNETFQRKRMLYTLRPGNSLFLPLPLSRCGAACE